MFIRDSGKNNFVEQSLHSQHEKRWSYKGKEKIIRKKAKLNHLDLKGQCKRSKDEYKAPDNLVVFIRMLLIKREIVLNYIYRHNKSTGILMDRKVQREKNHGHLLSLPNTHRGFIYKVSKGKGRQNLIRK